MCEQDLWAAVLHRAVEDILGTSAHSEYQEHREAVRWLHTYQSRDFRQVCALAGLDSDAVFDRLHAALAEQRGTRGRARQRVA